MSTVNIHWFHPIGFRPGIVVQREDFVGDSGVNEYVIVSPDADVPYSSKYDGPLDFAIPPEFIPEVPITNGLVPREEYENEFPFWNPPIYWCCGSIDPPIYYPPPPPTAIPTPDSLTLMLSAIFGLFIARHRVCLR